MFRTTKNSINIGPRLETDRLILRVPSVDDLDRGAEMMADENAARFIGGVAPKSRCAMSTSSAGLTCVGTSEANGFKVVRVAISW